VQPGHRATDTTAEPNADNRFGSDLPYDDLYDEEGILVLFDGEGHLAATSV